MTTGDTPGPDPDGTHEARDEPASFLPEVLPVFPLSGVLLLPGASLPLNIFEPRYLTMIEESLGRGRYIGMVQPRSAEQGPAHGAAGEPPIYTVGCAGRIVSFAETGDGRLAVTLLGVCRFAIQEELPLVNGYRRVVPDFSPYQNDLEEGGGTLIDRVGLLRTVKAYFTANNIEADWESVDSAVDAALVTTLAMACPFGASERQALLECADTAARGILLGDLMTLSLHGDNGDNALKH